LIIIDTKKPDEEIEKKASEQAPALAPSPAPSSKGQSAAKFGFGDAKSAENSDKSSLGDKISKFGVKQMFGAKKEESSDGKEPEASSRLPPWKQAMLDKQKPLKLAEEPTSSTVPEPTKSEPEPTKSEPNRTEFNPPEPEPNHVSERNYIEPTKLSEPEPPKLSEPPKAPEPESATFPNKSNVSPTKATVSPTKPAEHQENRYAFFSTFLFSFFLPPFALIE
jgi:hypothetical protein